MEQHNRLLAQQISNLIDKKIAKKTDFAVNLNDRYERMNYGHYKPVALQNRSFAASNSNDGVVLSLSSLSNPNTKKTVGP